MKTKKSSWKSCSKQRKTVTAVGIFPAAFFISDKKEWVSYMENYFEIGKIDRNTRDSRHDARFPDHAGPDSL